MEIKLTIDGMHCDACARRVRKALEKVPGAQVLDVAVGSARVELGQADRAAVEQAITQAGFTLTHCVGF